MRSSQVSLRNRLWLTRTGVLLMQPSLVPLCQECPAWERMDWPEDCLVQGGSQLRIHGTLRGLQTRVPHLSEKATEAFEGEEIC